MRIIGGAWRSRRLVRPSEATTRPMPDRVRQAIFDLLGSRFETPGALPPIRVVDLFAGSGSMGLEALSRGAAHCTFVERHRAVASVLRRNIESLGAGDRSRVAGGDAWKTVIRPAIGAGYDLVFLDPPYRDSADDSHSGKVRRFLRAQSSVGAPAPGIERHTAAGATVDPGDGPSVRANPLVVLHHPVGTSFAAGTEARPTAGAEARPAAGAEALPNGGAAAHRAVDGGHCPPMASDAHLTTDDGRWRVVDERRFGSNMISVIEL